MKEVPTCLDKWCELFEFENKEWENIFGLSFKCFIFLFLFY